jgi:hypothetical protein
MKDIVKVILQDKENVFDRMFELTSLKLAKYALQQNPKGKTLEELTIKSINEVQKQISSIQTSSEVSNKLVDIYKKYGRAQDLEKALLDFKNIDAKMKGLKYNKKETRLTNLESSAYVLTLALGKPEADFTEADAATIWAVERTRAAAVARGDKSFEIGQGNGNLLNVSTRVYHYLDGINSNRTWTDSDLAKKIAENERKLDAVIARAYVKIKEGFNACLVEEARKDNCADCASKRQDVFERENLNLLNIRKAILKSTSGDVDQSKLEQDLLKKYNFGNTKVKVYKK